jgi:hypothetical protein
MLHSRSRALLAFVAAALPLAACDDDPAVPEPPTAFTVTVENVSTVHPFLMSGSFDTPVGKTAAGPALPGDAYEFEFAAPPGARLSFASMFGQSNDLFYAPDEAGIDLFDGGQPVSGDVTAQIQLWDAGTEMDQEPGVGANQAPRQGAPDTGPADPISDVRPADDTFGNLPAVSDVMLATLTPLPGNRFRMRLENVGTGSTLQTSNGAMPAPFSPGVWVVHSDPAPLFTAGQADRGEGLERVAEEGNAAPLAASVAGRSGVVTPLSPGVWVVHEAPAPLFTEGQPDRGQGLEGIAEDADPAVLAAAVAMDPAIASSGVFSIPVGASAAGPIMPGNAYEFTVQARPGDRLSLATMFGQSNDLFYGPGQEGIALFTGDAPRSGDVSAEIMLWDAGTEVNEVPGAGPNQAPRQAGPDTGSAESRPIQAPDDGFTYPVEVIRVTLAPQGG